MKSNNRVPRGVLALMTIVILALLVWKLAPNNFFYPSIIIALCLAIVIILFIYRSSKNISDEKKSKKKEELSESQEENLEGGELIAETVPPVEDLSPVSSYRSIPGFRSNTEKPKATEVAAWYMKMAAIAKAEEEERNTLKPLAKTIETTIEELTIKKPAVDEAEATESNIHASVSMEAITEQNQSEQPESAPVVESTAGDPPMPIINEETKLTEEDKNQLENAVWYRCENPFCKYSHFLDVHHIVDEKDGGTNKLDNLIVLCPYCHDLAHKNEIPEKELRDWIGNREERFKFKLEWHY